MVRLSDSFWEFRIREGRAIKIAFKYDVGPARTV
jgi:hypothetical protein